MIVAGAKGDDWRIESGASLDYEGTRRVATLLFCDICDSARLAADLEAEDYAQILNDFRAKLQMTVSLHNDQIGQVYGDGALVVFVADVTGKETATQRAVATALELHAVAVNLGPPHLGPLRLHSGIHAGLVLMRQGDATRGRIEALGFATTIAARLAAAARPGEILVSDATLGPERRRFRTSSARDVVLDRTGDSIAAVAVAGRAETAAALVVAARAPHGLTPFVGRTRELARVEQDLAAALAGKAVATMFIAPPGQGKTRFAAEVGRLARDMGFAICAGASEAQGEPLQPFRQIVRALLDVDWEPDRVARDTIRDVLAAPEFATLMAATAAPPGGRLPDPVTVAAAVHVQVERLAARVPIVFLLDDWHWADSASVQVLKGLLAADGRIAIILLSRPPEFGDLSFDSIREVALPPLAENEGVDLIQRRLPVMDWLSAVRMHRAAGGNPLLIEELCHLADRGGAVVPDVAATGWLASAIEARFRRLPAALASLVLTAAVIGMSVSEDLLAEIAEVAIDDIARGELARRDFLFPADAAGRLRFKHGLARDNLYRLVSASSRRDLHGRIADAIAAREPEAHEALAFHYGESLRPALAAYHAEKAGDAAAAAASIDRAQMHYRAALASLDALPQTAEIGQRWATIVRRFAMIAVYDPEVAHIDLFVEARARALAAGDPLALAQAEYWVGYACMVTGSERVGLRHYQAGLDIAAAQGADWLVGELNAAMGHAHLALCNHAEALPLLTAGGVLMHKNGRRSLAAPPSLAWKAAVLADRGDFAAAYDSLEQALAMIAGSGHQVEATIRSWYAQILLWHGRPDEALVQAERDREVTEQTGNAYMNALARNFQARARFMLAPSDEDHARIAAATRYLEVRHKHLYISLFYGGAAAAAATMGDLPATRAAAARAVARARSGDRLGEAMAWRALARTAANPARAQHCLARADAAAAARGSPHEAAVNRLVEAELLVGSGAPGLARKPLDRARAEFERLAMPWFAARAEALSAAG